MNGRTATAIGVGLVLIAVVVVLVMVLRRKPHGGNSMRMRRTLRNDPNLCFLFDPSTLPLASTFAYPSKGKTGQRCGANPPSRGFVVWTANEVPLVYIDTTVPYQLNTMVQAAGDKLEWSKQAMLGDRPIVLGNGEQGNLYVMPAQRKQGEPQALVYADMAYMSDYSQINKVYCTAVGKTGAKCTSKTQQAWLD